MEIDREKPEGFMPLQLFFEAAGIRIEVTRPEVIVGRHSQADVRLALPDISRRHCRLVFENQQWRVYDLSSLNGVFVNGDRIQEATLYDGDNLQLASFPFQVEHRGPITLPRAEVMQRMAKRLAS